MGGTAAALLAALLGLAAMTPMQAAAEGMTGEQIKQALTGNTGTVKSNNQRFWSYYKADGTILMKSDQGMSDEGVWRVTPEGVYCAKWKKIRQGAEACWKNVQVSGSRLSMEGVDGAPNVVGELLPGNPQGF